MFHFIGEKGHFLSTNIVMILDGNKALLIDTGYKRHFLKIKQELLLNNIQLFSVVVSHFHPDHIGGLSRLSEVDIYGSDKAFITLKKFQSDYDHLLPTIKINGETSITFGKHKIDLEQNPGHSIDGLLITIDEKYLFVGDDLIYTDNKESVLPFCADHEIEKHIDSLKKIMVKSKNKIIIPSHGIVISDDSFIKKDIENRIVYLDYIQQNRTCSYEKFNTETAISFIGEESHSYNIK